MNYHWKRALTLSFVLYLSTFVVGILTGILGGVDMSSMENVPGSYWYVGMISAVVLSAICTHLYFNNPSILRTTVNGLYFGLTAVAFSTLLDLILFSLGNSQGANVNLIAYFSDVRFLTIVVLVIATTAVVGYLRSRQKAESAVSVS